MNPKSKFECILRSSLIRVFIREIDRISGSWVLLFTTILGPLGSFMLVTWIFSAAVVRDIPVTVVDMDHTQMSRKLSRITDAIPSANVICKSVSLEEAKSLMQKGETDAVLYIPKGFEKSVQRGIQTGLALYINNTNVVKGGVLQSQLTTSIASFSGAVKIQAMIKKGIPLSESLQKVQPIKPEIHLLFNPYSNYAYFLMMGLMPLLAVVFIFLGTAYAIGIEMKEGTGTNWIQTAGESTTVALIGKLTPYVLFFFGDLMVMNILLIKVMGTPFKWLICPHHHFGILIDSCLPGHVHTFTYYHNQPTINPLAGQRIYHDGTNLLWANIPLNGDAFNSYNILFFLPLYLLA